MFLSSLKNKHVGFQFRQSFLCRSGKLNHAKKKCKREKETIPSHYTGCSIGYNNPKKGFRKHFQKDDVCQFVPSFPPTVPAKFGGVYVKKNMTSPQKNIVFWVNHHQILRLAFSPWGSGPQFVDNCRVDCGNGLLFKNFSVDWINTRD